MRWGGGCEAVAVAGLIGGRIACWAEWRVANPGGVGSSLIITGSSPNDASGRLPDREGPASVGRSTYVPRGLLVKVRLSLLSRD